MNIKEIITKHLKDNDFDGLCGDQCGCFLDDLMPCSGSMVGGPHPECQPGYKITCPGEENCSNSDECPFPNNGMRCMTTKKPLDKDPKAK